MSSNSNPAQTHTPQMHGIVVLDKPAGPSSAQCLTVFKKQGQRKIGHAGTLDPMASGVLPVLLGHATKLSGWLLRDSRKVYSGTIRLGVETDTWDMEGRVLAEAPHIDVTPEQAATAIQAWTETTEQETPAFSAAKHNGQPLYRLARSGRETPVKIRKINIFEADMLNFSMPFVSFRVACGSGTYIRSLAHSLGKRLGCGGALAELRREYSHPFALRQSSRLDDIKEGLQTRHVLPVTAALPHWPLVQLTAAQGLDVRNGRPVPAGCSSGDHAFLCVEGKPIAIGRRSQTPQGLAQWLVERGMWD